MSTTFRGKTRSRRATQTHIAGTEERKKLPMHLYSVPSIIHVVPRPTRGNFAFRNPCKTIRRNCERCTTRSNAQQPPPLIFLARIHFCAQKQLAHLLTDIFRIPTIPQEYVADAHSSVSNRFSVKPTTHLLSIYRHYIISFFRHEGKGHNLPIKDRGSNCLRIRELNNKYHDDKNSSNHRRSILPQTFARN